MQKAKTTLENMKGFQITVTILKPSMSRIQMRGYNRTFIPALRRLPWGRRCRHEGASVEEPSSTPAPTSTSARVVEGAGVNEGDLYTGTRCRQSRAAGGGQGR